tara:strand:- start:33846 stop:35069 length:1224 start_codon:yes stop_codon:yes gene_type:complete
MVDQTVNSVDWQRLLDPDIQDFIHAHASDDVKQLALKKAPDLNWPYSLILDQIRVRQKAKTKSHDLYETDSFIFPFNETYEQASSSPCARYKERLVSGQTFVDLTAGSGADSFHIAQGFASSVLVERDAHSAELLTHNAQALQASGWLDGQISVHHGDACDYVRDMAAVDAVFIDPQRRENGRRALYDFSACSPDIMDLLPVLKTKAKKILVKASPFLDIGHATAQLQMVVQVHVVQWQNECKEVLYLLDCDSGGQDIDPEITAVDLDDEGRAVKSFSYFTAREKDAVISCAMPQKYIFEPGPAFQKAGGFKTMAAQYGVSKLHPNSQLYTAQSPRENFPGKCYEVVGLYPVKAKDLPVDKADLAVRNFPASVKELRKKLKLRDGGAHRIFATTLCDDSKKLILCLK